MKYKKLIVYFLMFLIVSIPIVIADSFSQFNKITGYDISENGDGSVNVKNGYGINLGFVSDSIDLPSPSQICTQKSEDIDKFLSFMDDEIDLLSKIIAIIHAIATILLVIQKIMAFLEGIWPGCLGSGGCVCKLPAWGNAVCVAIHVIYMIVSTIKNGFDFISVPMMCQYNGPGASWPWTSWCTKSQIGSKLGDPMSNIYVALACLCPTAILFNLRKLKVIYQTFNCCVKASCEKGVSTEGCYKYLDTATCTFWEGDLINAIWTLLKNLIISKVIKVIFTKIVTTIATRTVKAAIQAILELVNLYFEVTGLADAWENLQKAFDDPDCSGMLSDIGIDYTPSTTTMALSMNNEGLYTS
jgi:hypothetical protein